LNPFAAIILTFYLSIAVIFAFGTRMNLVTVDFGVPNCWAEEAASDFTEFKVN